MITCRYILGITLTYEVLCDSLDSPDPGSCDKRPSKSASVLDVDLVCARATGIQGGLIQECYCAYYRLPGCQRRGGNLVNYSIGAGQRVLCNPLRPQPQISARANTLSTTVAIDPGFSASRITPIPLHSGFHAGCQVLEPIH